MSRLDKKLKTTRYLGQEALLDLFSGENLGQYHTDGFGTEPKYRDSDATLFTYHETTNHKTNSFINGTNTSLFRDNYRFIPNNMSTVPKDANNGAPWVYSGTGTGASNEVQIVGEKFIAYGLTDPTYGIANNYVDGILDSTFDFATPATTTIVSTCETTEPWGAGSTSDAVNVKVGASSRKITNATPSTTLSSRLVIGQVAGVTFSSNNPVIITSAAHGLSTGNKIAVTVTSAAGSLAIGDYVITVTGANTFTIPFNGAGAGGTCTYSVVKDYSAMNDFDYFKFWVYINDATLASRVSVAVDTTATGSAAYTSFFSQSFSSNLVTGWNECILHRIDFTSNGTPDANWNHVVGIQLTLGRNATVGSCEASFDDIKFVAKTAIVTKVGLAANQDHAFKMVSTGGRITLGHVEVTATKKAAEYHRDALIMHAPVYATLGAMTGDLTWYNKAIDLMEQFRTKMQLGDRTSSNRSRYGAIGVGGSESFYTTASVNTTAQAAYHKGLATNINYLLPGESTVTSSAFVGVMIGLTYKVLEKAGVATQTQLTNWKTMIIALCEYYNTRGYTVHTYYNTGNGNALWGCALELAFQITGDLRYKGFSEYAINAYIQANPSDPTIHFFKGALEDMRNDDNVPNLASYLDEAEEETSIANTTGSAITATDTLITLTGTWQTDLGLTTASTGALLIIENELIKLLSYIGSNVWSVERGVFGSVPVAHSAGALIERGFDPGYIRVQSPTLYLYGLLADDSYFKRLAKTQFNAVAPRINVSTLDFDISGGSRNFSVVEGYWTNGCGLNFMSAADNDPYPSAEVVGRMLAGWQNLITANGFIPGDTVAFTASNIVQSFAYSSFALGWANSMKYLGYTN